MLHGNKDILHELVMVGYYGLLLAGLILLGVFIAKGHHMALPVAPGF